VKNSQDTITRAFTGDYRPEHVFALKQSLKAYRYYQELLAELDKEIHRQRILDAFTPVRSLNTWCTCMFI
jgi:hypothetical protein